MAEPFDMSTVQRGARLRRTPFYEATQRYGPKGMTVYNHMFFPIRFDDFEAEYWHLLNHVTLWDVSVERCVEISGPDGLAFTQLMTPRDLSTCAVGQAKYVLITAPDGGILNDPVLTRMDQDRFWLALASSDVLFYAKGLAAHAGMDVHIREADVSPLQIQGPKSKDVVRDLFGDQILDLRYYWFTERELDGIPVVVTRTGWTSEVGYEVYLCDSSGDNGTRLWERIMEAGAPYQIRPTGPSDIRRVEGGIFNWGADMTYENDPLEMGLERLVDWDMEGRCLAMDALKRIRDEGVTRRIVGVELDGDGFPALNSTKWPVSSNRSVVGKVTSAVHSPRLEKNIGYAWVPAAMAEHGTTLDVECEWGDRTATVVALPFYDPEKQIPKS
ncbi:MAG TPA: glycine cleavage T C-terminal barrel domain-containing protein [Actinomycetota bacterium]|nr:glycine cleavage T C-terminal barrel domain-containing protein [Actinomycetota bacterium]